MIAPATEFCHSGENRNPVLSMVSWIPAFAGMTIRVVVQSSLGMTLESAMISGFKKIFQNKFLFQPLIGFI